jgi:predicted GNAT family acetyltransferase
MRIVVTRDLDEFVERVAPFLAAAVERNILATVLEHARRGRYAATGPFAYVLDDGGEVRGAALRTPPGPMLACDLDDDTADALVALWLSEDPALAGVCGKVATARAVAAAWARRTRGRARCHMREQMHALSQVTQPPRPAAGELRLASTEQRALLIAWQRAFDEELGLAERGMAERSVDARMAGGGLLVWDDGGAVSMVGLAPQVAGVVRIGPVYTPPRLRGRGYASSAVAAACRRALAAGARRCVLFTDVDNPTSNRIYASVGFRPFEDWEDHRFEQR